MTQSTCRPRWLSKSLALCRSISIWQVATGTVYPTTPLHCWAFHETFRPSQNVAVFVDAEEFRRVKCSPTDHQTAIPGEGSDIGNRIVFSENGWTSAEARVENVKLPLPSIVNRSIVYSNLIGP